MKVNKAYDKKKLKGKISKPKLWDTLAMLSNQMIRKGDTNNVFNLRRQTAKFHNPSPSPKKKDPKDFLKIIAAYLNKMLKQRKKKKLKKQTNRNIKRMARQIYKVGHDALKEEEPERSFKRKPK